MAITHATSAPTTSPGITSSHWNAGHLSTFIPLSYSASGTLPSPPNLPDVIEATGGGSGITLQLPAAAQNPGIIVRVKKVDAGAGAITLQDALGATIDGGSTYLLVNQYQYVWLYASSVTGTWGVIAQGGD